MVWPLALGCWGIIGFLVLLKRHQSVQRRRDRVRWLAFINRDETARLERKFLRPETGLEFADANHPYAGDLDIFGNHSIFRLLNRTYTYEGSRKLAAYLRLPVPVDEVLLRQDAVAELRALLDWRQELAALAYLNPSVGESPQALKNWATQTGRTAAGVFNRRPLAVSCHHANLAGALDDGLFTGLGRYGFAAGARGVTRSGG
jgi:hypothetical protein